jgi:hypothetical protein
MYERAMLKGLRANIWIGYIFPSRLFSSHGLHYNDVKYTEIFLMIAYYCKIIYTIVGSVCSI